MYRPTHYLKNVRSSPMPERILIFDTRYVVASAPNAAGIFRCEMESWHGCVMNLVNGEYVNGTVRWSKAPPTFWHWVKGNLLPKKTVWAIGFGVCFQFALNGFWELLQDEEWQLTGVDPCDNENILRTAYHTLPGEIEPVLEVINRKYPKRGRNNPGICVIEDEPTIVLATPNFGRSNVKFVDIRNFGVDSPAREKSGAIDVQSMAGWVAGFCKTLTDNNLGGLQSTAASQAMHSYKHRFMDKLILVHGDGMATALERSSLHCGRNECFKIGNVHGPVYHLDFNSFYAAIARDAQCPSRLIGSGPCDTATLDYLIAKGYCVFADVLLGCHEPCYPTQVNGRLCFPIGTFRTTLAMPELVEAYENESIIKVFNASWYETDNLFQKWTDELFALRMKYRNSGDKPGEETCKRLIVSVFGKFAQWAWQWVHAPNVEAICPYGEWWAKRPLLDMYGRVVHNEKNEFTPETASNKTEYCRWQSIGWNVRFEGERSEHRNSCPAIPSHIYSLARIKLLEAMRIAGYDNVYYCDADSLWVNHTGMRCLERANYLHDTDLGRMKLQAVWPHVKFLGLKHYEVPGKITHAGVPNHAVQIGERTWEFQSSERMHGALSQLRSPEALLHVKTIAYREPYRHGKVAINGRVSPLVLNETL